MYWSPSSKTALAEAELEYNDQHRSKSIYLALRVRRPSPALASLLSSDELYLSIWTTTPWTIPANLAVAVNDKLEYAIVRRRRPTAPDSPAQYYIIATDLVENVKSKFQQGTETAGEEFEIVGRLSGAELADTTYTHPLFPEKELPVVIGKNT